MHEPSYLDHLFDGKSSNARSDPIPVGTLSPERQEKAAKEDKSRCTSNPVLDMISSAQQYGAVWFLLQPKAGIMTLTTSQQLI